MTVSDDGQIDRIYNHPRDGSLGMPMQNYLDHIN